ncbi:hypothetical protein [Bacillus haynesii]|nr:hypothetical protein [Bacillus haynesii]MCY9324079.1 hypothetical protein [Bacillus haynesii]
MTIQEIFDMAIAYYRRRDEEMDEQMHILAWQTSHIMNSSGNYKKTIKPSHLYGGNDEHEGGSSNGGLTPIDRDKKNEQLAALEEKFNRKN